MNSGLETGVFLSLRSLQKQNPLFILILNIFRTNNDDTNTHHGMDLAILYAESADEVNSVDPSQLQSCWSGLYSYTPFLFFSSSVFQKYILLYQHNCCGTVVGLEVISSAKLKDKRNRKQSKKRLQLFFCARNSFYTGTVQQIHFGRDLAPEARSSAPSFHGGFCKVSDFSLN